MIEQLPLQMKDQAEKLNVFNQVPGGNWYWFLSVYWHVTKQEENRG